MQQSIRILCNIYNFIDIVEPSSKTISLQFIEQFRQIFLLINQFISNEYIHPKSIFEELSMFINREEEVFGPKKFRRLIENISNIILEFVLENLRHHRIDSVFSCLTYYEKYCSKYFTHNLKVSSLLVYALAHFQKMTFNNSESYIAQCKQLIRCIQKSGDDKQATMDAKTIIDILEAIFNLKKGILVKSKFLFNQIIGKLTKKMHEQQIKSKSLRPQTISFFIITTFYIAEVYQALKQNQKSQYHITQCRAFAQTHLQNKQLLILKLDETYQFLTMKKVKLTRTQNKIQRMKSLHNFGNTFSRIKSSSKQNWNNQGSQFKISKAQKKMKIGVNIEKDLQDLMIIEEDNQARLKKKTLKILHGENVQKQKKIESYQAQIRRFAKIKLDLSKEYQNQICQKRIQQQKQQRNKLKAEIASKIWDAAPSLKFTRKIQNYLKCFSTQIQYQKTNNFLKFFYNQVSFNCQVRLYSILRRIRSRLVGVKLITIYIHGIRHQLQLSKHKERQEYHMKIYRVERGLGIDSQIQVQKTIYLELLSNPFCYYFQIFNGQIFNLKDYLTQIPINILMRVKKFCSKLKKRVLRSKKQLFYDKKQVNVTFNSYYKDLTYTMFITHKRLDDGTYNHTIERIDRIQYPNSDYNIRFNMTVNTTFQQICEYDIAQLVMDHLIQQKSRCSEYIIKIQRLFRLNLAKNMLMRQKQTIQVSTVFFARNIFSLVATSTYRNFYIENIDKEYPSIVLKSVNFYNLAFLYKIKDQFINDNCSEQLNVINHYFRLRQFAFKFIKKSQQVKLDTNFSTKFKKSLCFAKIMKQYLYRGKFIDGKMMYMLTVADFQAFPRPYMLRVFTIENKNLYIVDYEQKIYNSEKIFLENNIDKINQFIDIQEHKKANILFEGPVKLNFKMRRQNSKSLVSNFSFGSGQEFFKQRKSGIKSKGLFSRQSSLATRNKKNSINFKMRHKSALKQKDILLIKKWIEQSKEDSLISQSEQSSTY